MPLLDANDRPIAFWENGQCDDCRGYTGLAYIARQWLCEKCAAPHVEKWRKHAASREEI